MLLWLSVQYMSVLSRLSVRFTSSIAVAPFPIWVTPLVCSGFPLVKNLAVPLLTVQMTLPIPSASVICCTSVMGNSWGMSIPLQWTARPPVGRERTTTVIYLNGVVNLRSTACNRKLKCASAKMMNFEINAMKWPVTYCTKLDTLLQCTCVHTYVIIARTVHTQLVRTTVVWCRAYVPVTMSVKFPVASCPPVAVTRQV